MQDGIIVSLVWLAMIATSFWEAYSEGKNSWSKHKLGWKIGGRVPILTAYHFWLFYVTFPALLAIPLVVSFSWHLFGLLLGAYLFGVVIEDFFWFVVNPVVRIDSLNPHYDKWQSWIKIGGVNIPLNYIVGISLGTLVWVIFL
jgi:hypothetical protein